MSVMARAGEALVKGLPQEWLRSTLHSELWIRRSDLRLPPRALTS